MTDPIRIEGGLLWATPDTDPEDLAAAVHCWRALTSGRLVDVRVSDLPRLAAVERITRP